MATRPRASDPKRAALRRLDVFSAFSDAELDSLAELAQLRRYARGRTLVKQGDLSEAAFGIVSGRLRVSLSRADGSEATLTLLGPGELVGELGLFEAASRSAHVTALEDACVLTVGKSAFLGALKRSPAASLELCRLLASRVRQLAQHFEEVTAVPVEQRLARKLVFLAARWGAPTAGGVGLNLKLSQQELAELVDTSRQSANKCLSKWRSSGVLASSTRTLVIRDLSALQRCAGTSVSSFVPGR
ncbi:MAG TPA: Crp/Fnr family transcriptional regulator [Polyangiaceae bacterium]|nr:Crp/Fnr family transcriptional regulator [Polyangiaceae bacterium]